MNKLFLYLLGFLRDQLLLAANLFEKLCVFFFSFYECFFDFFHTLQTFQHLIVNL